MRHCFPRGASGRLLMTSSYSPAPSRRHTKHRARVSINYSTTFMYAPARIIFTFAALCLVAVHATTCPQDCNAFKLNDPPKPEEAGTNVGLAVVKILDGMFTAMRAKAFPDAFGSFAYIAGGLLNGIWGATHAENPSKMAEYKMQKDLKQMGDYLSCVMEGQVSNAVYKIEQRMDQQLIDSFNNAVNGIVTGMTRDCMQRNCLNFTNIEPSKRNEAAGASCMAAYTPITDCRNVTWNPRAPRLCKGSDSFGATYEGICSVDGQCYYSSVGFQGTIAYYRQIKATFENSPAILNFNAFNNLYSPAAVVAYAKAVPVYLAIMQELFLLGSATAEDAKMRAFVTEAAQWLQSRVEFHTNITKSPLMTVMDATDWAADPLRLRYSCKPEDLLDTVYACSSLSSFSTDKQVALMLTQKTGNSDKLCVEFDTTGDGQAMEPYRKRPDLFAVTTFNAQARSAASPLAAKNQKLFENAGVYSIIKTLGDMATAPNIMPPGSFKAYQDQFTPRLACTGPKPTLGATAIKPLGTWEAPDNLSKGSVVLKGVVIGGEAMQRVAAGNAPQAAVAAPKGARRLL